MLRGSTGDFNKLMPTPEEESKLRVMLDESKRTRTEESVLREGLYNCAQHNDQLVLENQKLRLEVSVLLDKIAQYEKESLQTKNGAQEVNGSTAEEPVEAHEPEQGELAQAVCAEAGRESPEGR
jgi:spore germination cell wall hydrolase CwlJ-like protein